MSRVSDLNLLKYIEEAREDLQNDLLEKIAEADSSPNLEIFHSHINKFSEQEGRNLLYGLASRCYIRLNFVAGPDGKVIMWIMITDAGLKYAKTLSDSPLKISRP